MATVSNSSQLIAFAAIGQLSLLPGIFQSILIPPAVAIEITPSIPALPPWLHVEGLKEPLPVLNRTNGLRVNSARPEVPDTLEQLASLAATVN